MLFHITANADWSNLPLAGLFVDMLRRLVQLSVGVAATQSTAMLAPAETLDGFGLLNQPPPTATGLQADKFASTAVSVRHPPGLYGPESGRQVLNLGSRFGNARTRAADRGRKPGNGAWLRAGARAGAALAGGWGYCCSALTW